MKNHSVIFALALFINLFYAISANGQNNASPTVRCKGITAAGEQCKLTTRNANGYCHLHQKQASDTLQLQCKGKDIDGAQCNLKTSNPNGYCDLHQAQAPVTQPAQQASPAPARQQMNNTQTRPARRATSVQCSGTTRSGTRCKNKTLSPNGLCHLHGGN
jgi:hypothetical protein